jgi:hypothetical protein
MFFCKKVKILYFNSGRQTASWSRGIKNVNSEKDVLVSGLSTLFVEKPSVVIKLMTVVIRSEELYVVKAGPGAGVQVAASGPFNCSPRIRNN